MGGKDKQRTKGNLKPSSSGSAAALISKDGTVGFVGFGGLTGSGTANLGYVPMAASDDADSAVDAEFRMVMRKLMKRDAVTKLKAVQEFTHLCKNSTSEAVESALPFWPRLFNKLALDVDYRVREATQQAMEQLVIRVGRNLAPHLRYVIGPWSCAQFDTFAVVASSAKKAFQAAFAEEKHAEAILFCRKELFEFLQDNILTQTASTLSDPKFVEEEDRETKYIRVLSSSILTLGNLISVTSSHAKPDMEEHYLKILKQNKFWKYARHKSPNVRGALFSVISTSCEHLPSLMSSFSSQVSPAVLSVLDDSEPAVCQHLWEAVLSVLKNVTDCWRHVSICKAVLPKLWSVLKNGGSGCAAVVFPNLLPFLSKLPPEVASNGTGFYQEFFSNMQEGLAKESVVNSPSECSAVVAAFMECLRFCLVHGLSGEQPNPAVQEYLIKQQLITLLKTTLERKSKLAHSNLYPLVANLLSYLSTNSDSEKEETVCQQFGHILKWFWEDFSCVCMQSLRTTDAEEPNAGNMDTISHCLISLKCPAKKTKRFHKVAFAFPSSEQNDYASDTTNRTKTAERNTHHSNNFPESAKADLETLYNGCLLDLVCNICTLCFDKITEKRLSLYLRLLSRLVPHFQSVRLMKTLLRKANKYSDGKDYVGLSEQFVMDIIFPWLNSCCGEDIQCSKQSEFESTPLVFDSRSVEYLIDLFCGIIKTLSEEKQTELVSHSLQQDDSVHFLYRVVEKGLDAEIAGVIAWLRTSEASERILELSRYLVLHRDQSALSFKVFPEGDRNIVWNLLKLCIVTKRTVIKPDRDFLDKIFQHFLRILRQTQREDELELSRLLEILQMFLTACVDNPGDIVPCTDDLLLAVFQLRLSEPFHQPTMSEQLAATWRSGLNLLSHLPSDMASSPCQTLLLRAAAVVQEKLMKIETLDRVDELVAVAMSLMKEAKILCSVDSEEASLAQKVFLSWIPSRDELAFLKEDYSKSSWLFAPLEDNKLPVLSEICDSLTESHTAGFTLTKHQKAVVFPALLVKQIISDCSEADSQLARETLTRDCYVHLWLEMNWLQQWCKSVMGCRDRQQESLEFCQDGCTTVYNLLLKLTVISDHVMEHVKHHDWCDNLLTEALSRSRTQGFLWCLVLGSALDSFRKLGVPFDLTAILAESSALFDEKECQTLFTVIHRVESIYELKVITEQYLTFSQKCNGESGFAYLFTIIASCLSQWFKLTKQDEPAVFEYQLTLTSVLDELLECNKKQDNFLLLNSSLENASVCVLTLNLAVNRLLEMAALHCTNAMTTKHWDFLLCSLAGWLQTCEENKSSLTTSLKCAVLCCQTCSLFCTVTQFFEDNISQLAKESKSQRADEANNKTECCSSESTSWLSSEFGGYPPNLFSEWQEFFSGNLFGIVLNLFLYHADQSLKMHDERSLWLNRVSESLGLAVIHIPTSIMKEHALEVSAPDITEGTSNLPQWIEDLMGKCLPLLMCDLRGLKFAAYHLLSRAMAEITFTDDKEAEGDKEEDVIRSPPTGLMKLIQSTSRHMTDMLSDAAVPFGEHLDMTNDLEAQNVSLALMLAWKLLLQFFRSMSQEKRVEYAKYIKHHKLVNSLLAVLFRLIPLKKNGLVIANECEPTIGRFSGQRTVQEMACLIYYSLCQWMPAIVRQWWNGLDKRQSAVVDKFTTSLIAPQLCQREMQLVQNSALRFDNMQVKTRPSAREVAAVYTVDEISMELVVKLAGNHPLGVVSVESGKKIGVTAAQWRSWMLQMTTFLTHQNGSIMDGLVLWKRNVDKRFEGVDDCMICFSVIHGSNYSLPKLSCKTCKKRFHSACLYKWFSTSNQATCPLCRNLF